MAFLLPGFWLKLLLCIYYEVCTRLVSCNHIGSSFAYSNTNSDWDRWFPHNLCEMSNHFLIVWVVLVVLDCCFVEITCFHIVILDFVVPYFDCILASHTTFLRMPIYILSWIILAGQTIVPHNSLFRNFFCPLLACISQILIPLRLWCVLVQFPVIVVTIHAVCLKGPISPSSGFWLFGFWLVWLVCLFWLVWLLWLFNFWVSFSIFFLAFWVVTWYFLPWWIWLCFLLLHLCCVYSYMAFLLPGFWLKLLLCIYYEVCTRLVSCNHIGSSFAYSNTNSDWDRWFPHNLCEMSNHFLIVWVVLVVLDCCFVEITCFHIVILDFVVPYFDCILASHTTFLRMPIYILSWIILAGQTIVPHNSLFRNFFCPLLACISQILIPLRFWCVLVQFPVIVVSIHAVCFKGPISSISSVFNFCSGIPLLESLF